MPEMDSITAQYLQNLTRVGGLYTMAMMARAGMLQSYISSIQSLYAAQSGGLVLTDAAAAGALVYGGLPVITMVGVFVALGSGYAAAREIVKDENARIGFAEGFVMGLLGWNGHQVVNLFGRQRVLRLYQMDEQLDVIRVNSYNKALAAGYTAALAMSAQARGAFLQKLRNLAGHPSTGDWTRVNQISFVIALATAGIKIGLLKAQ